MRRAVPLSIVCDICAVCAHPEFSVGDRACWGYHFDVVFRGKPLVEGVRVVGFVADESGGEVIKEAADKNIFNKLALGRRSAFDR